MYCLFWGSNLANLPHSELTFYPLGHRGGCNVKYRELAKSVDCDKCVGISIKIMIKVHRLKFINEKAMTVS